MFFAESPAGVMPGPNLPKPEGTGIGNAISDFSVTVSPGATAAVTDDTYTINFKSFGRNMGPAVSLMAPSIIGPISPVTGSLGPFPTTTITMEQGNRRWNFTLFDLTTTLTGSLDYVQLSELSFLIDDGICICAGDSFLVYGNTTLPANMPTTGSASFAGPTVAKYRQAGALTATNALGDVTMNANFGTGAVTGAATNFRTTAGAALPLDFNFNAAIASGTPLFQGTASMTNAVGPGLSGVVQGAFFGPAGAGPDEAGLAYQFGGTGANLGTNATSLSGAAVLGRQP